MIDDRDTTTADRSHVREVPPEEWPSWCARATSSLSGRELVLHVADQALGDVRLAQGQPFVAIEHDDVGGIVALTIKYGSGVVPVNYVIAQPQAVRQHLDEAGDVQEVSIIDTTGRRTYVGLA